MKERCASLSLDLDDQWTYWKTRGLAGWESLPTYLPVVAPRILRFLAAEDLRITFFVVGQDAALPRNGALLRAMAAEHEMGNHSFRHEPWLHRYSEDETAQEIARAEEAIEAAVGVRPVGFRGPGFSTTDAVRRVLVERGYQYDASPCANVLGPLARAWYFRGAQLTAAQQEERSQLAGGWREAFASNRPGRVAGGALLQIPVTTLPGFRVPFHFSYLLALPRQLGFRYLQTALLLCRAAGHSPSLLMHPTEFLGEGDAHGLPFFPGMVRSAAEKQEQLREMLALVRRYFPLAAVGEQATRLSV